MKTIKGQLQISEDGRIWFNQESDGRCVLRIQGLRQMKKKLQNWEESEQVIDIRLDGQANNRESLYP